MPDAPFSLKGLIPLLSRALAMSPAALYERQRALVRAGLLKSEGGKGPGSGVRATPQSVGLLLIAVLAADSLSEIEDATARVAGLRALADICPATGKKTFASAIAAVLASPELSRGVQRITVDRRGIVAPGAHFDFVKKDGETCSSYFVSAKHKRPGLLEIRASLMGFPLASLFGLLAGNEPLPSELEK